MLADLSAWHALFLRRTPANADLAGRSAITRENFDVQGFIDRAGRADPVPAFALHSAALMLLRMGWPEHANWLSVLLSK